MNYQEHEKQRIIYFLEPVDVEAEFRLYISIRFRDFIGLNEKRISAYRILKHLDADFNEAEIEFIKYETGKSWVKIDNYFYAKNEIDFLLGNSNTIIGKIYTKIEE